MTTALLYIGIAITLLGVGVLIYMGLKARNTQNLPNEQKSVQLQKLIVLNFIGIGVSTIGLVMIVLSRVF